MATIGIVAVALNGAIGKGGRVPWHYSEDVKFFRRQTLHNACVMGRQTWLSLKEPLRERLNVVLSSSPVLEHSGSVLVVPGRAAVFELQRYLSCHLFIIGGEKTYRTFLNDIDEWFVTHIPVQVEDADAFIPPEYLEGFSLTEEVSLNGDLRVEHFSRVVSEQELPVDN